MADMRAARTKQYLRDALMTLLREKPYEAITVREVTERAQVSKNSFYNHYLCLDALVQDCYLQQIIYFRQPNKRLRDYATRTEAVTETLNERAHIMLFLRQNINMSRVILANITTSAAYEEAFQEEVDLLIDHIVTEYGPDPRPPFEPQYCARYIVSGMYGLLTLWITGVDHRPLENAAKEAVFYALTSTAGMVGHTIEPEYLEAINNWHFDPVLLGQE